MLKEAGAKILKQASISYLNVAAATTPASYTGVTLFMLRLGD
jgi:hypothetical protein